MDLKTIKEKVKIVFEDLFPEIKGKSFDFNKKQDMFEKWDSFSHMELVSKIEETFGINLEIDEVVMLDAPAKFVEVVQRKKK